MQATVDERIASNRSIAWPTRCAGGSPIPPEAVLLAEVQHRTANDFAVAIGTLHAARRHAPPCGRDGIDEAIIRLTEQAALSRLLIPPTRGGDADLRQIVRELCLALARARLEAERITITFDVASVRLPARICWMLSAVIAELVVNAAKHAFGSCASGDGHRGAVRVRSTVELGTLVVIVADDGVGVDDESRTDLRAGQGSLVIAALLDELGADHHRRTTPRGTVVEIVMPLER